MPGTIQRRASWCLCTLLVLYSCAPPAPELEHGSCDETREWTLRSDEYVRVWLDGGGPVEVRLVGPSGELVASGTIQPGAPAPLSAAVTRSGRYRLELDCAIEDAVPRFRVETTSGARTRQLRALDRDLRRAQELMAPFWEVDRRQAIEILERSLERHRDPFVESRTYVSVGNLYRELGEASRALELYQNAFEIGFAHDDPAEIDAYVGTAFAYIRLDQATVAKARAENALALSRSLRDPAREAHSFMALAEAHQSLGDGRRALERFHDAFHAFRRIGLERGEASALLHLGFAESHIGKNQQALITLNRALEMARRSEDRRIEAQSLLARGHVFSLLGEKQQALRAYTESAPLLERIGDPFWTAGLHGGMGFVYDELGDWDAAITHHLRALEMNERIGSPWGQAAALVSLGRAERSRGDAEGALAYHRRALSLARELGDTGLEASALADIASLSDALGHEVAAQNDWALSLALSRDAGFQRQEVDVLNELGRVDVDRGRVDAAAETLESSLKLSRQIAYPLGQTTAQFQLARLELRAGRVDEARRRSEEAIATVEQLRSNVSSYRLRASFFASVRAIQAFYIDVLVRLHERSPGRGFDELAFQASEAARARSLLEILSAAPRPSPAVDDVESLEVVRERVRVRAAEREIGQREPDRDELSGLLQELDFLRTELRLAGSPVSASENAPVTLTALRKALDPETVLLTYQLGEDRSFLWAVQANELDVHILPSRAHIESLAREAYRLLAPIERGPEETSRQLHHRARAREERFWATASSLSELLLAPVFAELGTKRLIVVGDGILNQLPFSALPLPGSSPPTPLVAAHEIVRLPSASVLPLLRTRGQNRASPDNSIAVIADPVFGVGDPRVSRADNVPRPPDAWGLPQALRDVMLSTDAHVPRLLASRQEARRILDFVPEERRLEALGFDANRALVTDGDLAGYKVVHFATHGILDAKHAELSGIILSLVDEHGRPRDGFVRLHELYDLDMPVDLVVLSACSTALGENSTAEGIVGLVRGFLSAGASSVVASYWNVDDAATAELMTRFYRNMFDRRLGPAAALRRAQLTMWNEKRWQAPFYWAAFELQGEWA